MSYENLAEIFYLGLIASVIFGIAWCIDKFLCSGSLQEQAWHDVSKAINRANHDVAMRERLRPVKE